MTARRPAGANPAELARIRGEWRRITGTSRTRNPQNDHRSK
ncbi:hypothetical protein [Yinghuangia sp. YIM S09857]